MNSINEKEIKKVCLFQNVLSKYKIHDSVKKYETLKAMVDALNDKYAQILSASEMDNIYIPYMLRDLCINGFVLEKEKSGKVKVKNCAKDCEAYKRGMRVGDVVVFVGDDNLIEKSILQIYVLLRKRPIQLVLHRDENTMKMVLIKTEKCMMNKNNMPISHILHKRIGEWNYIKIPSFSNDTYRELTESIRFGDKLVFDLRGNSGGAVEACLSILNMLVFDGSKIGMIKWGTQKEIIVSDNKENRKRDIYLVINEKTASVAEFFASAILFNGGYAVGRRTCGKGMIQTILSFAHIDGTGVKFSVAEMLTADGTEIEERGIEPQMILDQVNHMYSPCEIIGIFSKIERGKLLSDLEKEHYE